VLRPLLSQALRFPSRVNVVGTNLEEDPLFGGGSLLHPIAKKGLSIWLGLARRLLPVHLSLAFGEDRGFRHSGTSVSVDGISGDLAV
jgi:hypothetical protein